MTVPGIEAHDSPAGSGSVRRCRERRPAACHAGITTGITKVAPWSAGFRCQHRLERHGGPQRQPAGISRAGFARSRSIRAYMECQQRPASVVGLVPLPASRVGGASSGDLCVMCCRQQNRPWQRRQVRAARSVPPRRAARSVPPRRVRRAARSVPPGPCRQVRAARSVPARRVRRAAPGPPCRAGPPCRQVRAAVPCRRTPPPPRIAKPPA